MAAITLSAAYTKSKACGTNLELRCLTIDSKQQTACVVLEMKDGTGFLAETVIVDANSSGSVVTKLNGDKKSFTTTLNFGTIQSANATGEVGVASHIATVVGAGNFISGT